MEVVKKFRRRYDMPPGQDVCVAYQMFMSHVAVGRAVGVVAVVLPDGSRGTYVYSGEVPDRTAAKHKSPNDPSGWGVEMTIKAKKKAKEAGFVVL